MTNTKSPANMLHQMAQLANELEAQGAEIIGVSLEVVRVHHGSPNKGL